MEKPGRISLLTCCSGWNREKKIGALAQQLYPGGVFVYASDSKTAASLTRELMEDPRITIIFEGTFMTGNYVAKADILIRNGDSWDLVEVKSDVQQKQDYLEDMAYTPVIARNSGFTPAPICLQRWIARRKS